MGFFGPGEKEIAAAVTRALDARSLENPSVSLSDPAAWAALFGSWNSAAGVTVDVDTALTVPAVWAAVNFISSTMASLPLELYRRTDKGRDTADSDPLYSILHDAPNEEWSSFSWRKYVMQTVLLRGRSCTFIERNRAGRVMNLWPLDPSKLTVERINGRLTYRYTDKAGGEPVTYQPSEIIDIVWMRGFDGVCHFDPVAKMRDTIGLSIAMTNYASRFFENGGVPPLQLVGPLTSAEGIRRAGIDISNALMAAKEDGRPILPMPMNHKLEAIGIDPEKGQLTEARRFQLEEFARIFQLPPTFLQDLTHGTFSNTEQQDLHVVKHTLTQWTRCLEQEMNLKLFSRRNRKNFVEFNVDGLLRGDFKTRFEGYGQAIQNGINTPNEVRRMENWPDMPGGDQLFMQGAMMPIEKLGEAPAAPAPAEETIDDDAA